MGRKSRTIWEKIIINVVRLRVYAQSDRSVEYWGIGKRQDQDENEKKESGARRPGGGVTEIDYTRPVDSIMGHFSSVDDRLYLLPPRKMGSGATAFDTAVVGSILSLRNQKAM